MRKLIWIGILLGLVPLYMGSACGGHQGWSGQDTSGVDAKINEEVSVSGLPLESGTWTYYANYNDDTAPGMVTISSYVDHTAPFGVFTTDGLGTQHFNTHVGTGVAIANDRNKDGSICWQGCPLDTGSGDYTIPNGFCPAVGGTGSSSSSNGFAAYCNKGLWEVLIGVSAFTETKQKASGTSFENAKYGNYTPFQAAQVLATSTPNPNAGVTTTVSAISLPSGASHTLTTPITATVLGFGSAIAINANQAGLVEAANWLAGQWAGQPDGATNVTLSFNGGAASMSFTAASGNTASLVLSNFAATH